MSKTPTSVQASQQKSKSKMIKWILCFLFIAVTIVLVWPNQKETKIEDEDTKEGKENMKMVMGMLKATMACKDLPGKEKEICLRSAITKMAIQYGKTEEEAEDYADKFIKTAHKAAQRMTGKTIQVEDGDAPEETIENKQEL